MEEQKRIKYFMDFDDTLFDRDRFAHERLYPFIEDELGFSRTERLATYKAVYDKGYAGILAHLDKLSESYPEKLSPEDLPKAKERALEVLQKNLEEFIFPEAKAFLEEIDQDKYDIYIITVGETDFQEMKVKGSGISKFFEYKIFTGYKTTKEAELEKYLVDKDEHFILLEDKDFTIKRVREKYPNALVLKAEAGDLMKYVDPEALIAREGQVNEPITESVSQSHEQMESTAEIGNQSPEQEVLVVEPENPSSEEGGHPRVC